MIKLIATDMDGTLLNNDNQFPEDFFYILDKLTRKGIYFAVASGRQYKTLLSDFELVEDKIVFIAENGALVMQNSKELFFRAFDRLLAEEVIKDVRETKNCDIVLCGKKSAYTEATNDEFNANVKKYYKMHQVVSDLLKVEDEILKVAVYDYYGSMENSYGKLAPKWESKVNLTVSGSNWIDFAGNDTDKGIALKKLQNTFNINENETLVFGDYFNDVSMMEAAYHSYAMENAPDGVKAKANFIAPSNSDDGVIKTILKLERDGLL